MKAFTYPRTTAVAALVGGITGSVVLVVSKVGAISVSHVAEVAALGGVVGAFFAVISSAVVVRFGTVGRHAMRGTAFAAFIWSVCLSVSSNGAAVYCAVGLALLAGVLAASSTRRAGTVGAAGTATPQGQNRKSSGQK
ncbi:hypothetical protein GWI34_27865 [Actinomadura sp. DSM 109109]|nr:hypothetical protein [Actinomadura lepetitiana]